MLAPANYYFLYQELCFFVCLQPVKMLHSAPLRVYYEQTKGSWLLEQRRDVQNSLSEFHLVSMTFERSVLNIANAPLVVGGDGEVP